MRTIIELAYDLKKSLGKWYTVFLRIILPFLLYILPINVIVARTSDWMFARLFPGVFDLLHSLRAVYFLAVTLFSLLIFLIILIKLPKAASVIEFVFGFFYIFLAIKFGYFSVAGIILMIALSVFLFFKLLFLIVNIMYDITYGSDDVERGASGRRVRKSDSDFFFG